LKAIAAALAGALAVAMPPSGCAAAAPAPANDAAIAPYSVRDVMIPMRDGVRLHTLILIPRGAVHLSILLNRTPYGAAWAVGEYPGAPVKAAPVAARTMIRPGYIVVAQDIRGRNGSEGDYVANRPLIGPLNRTHVDHSTDAYDTIDWLVKNLPESNGEVGVSGTSYGGFLALMAAVHPHPALKVVVAIAPMVDTWRGDDWFHNGAFRQEYAVEYGYGSLSPKDRPARGDDDYRTFLAAGSAHDVGIRFGEADQAYWKRFEDHPAYDAFWREQALDRIAAVRGSKVPIVYVQGLWDQEDIYGATAAYHASAGAGRRYLLIGPWDHGGANDAGASLGSLVFNGDTSAKARRTVQALFDGFVNNGKAPADILAVQAYETGSNQWRAYRSWPPPTALRRLYLQPKGGLSFTAPRGAGPSFDQYVSDPANPVPYRSGRIGPLYAPDSPWSRWLASDQRAVSDRNDVVGYVTAPLTRAIKIAGQPAVHLVASTSGTDSDWVVKLIDVYPESTPGQPAMNGYELPIGMDIFRGRYRTSLSRPHPLASGKPLAYDFSLPTANHVFLPGHRIMVQVQSSWFPLYDRNPQTFVPNIFFAKPGDYRKALQRVFHDAVHASTIALPVEQDGGRD
jgi:hypothetical protein